MFEVQSYKLIQSLVKRARDIQQKLVTRMLDDHQKANKKLVGSLFVFSARVFSLYISIVHQYSSRKLSLKKAERD